MSLPLLHFECRLVKKDGNVINIEVSSSAIVYQRRWALLCYVKDITEQRRAEEAFRGSEKKCRIIIENITDLIAEVDRHGHYIYVSPSYKKILGYDAKDLMNRPANRFVHPDDAEELLDLIRTMIHKKLVL